MKIIILLYLILTNIGSYYSDILVENNLWFPYRILHTWHRIFVKNVTEWAKNRISLSTYVWEMRCIFVLSAIILILSVIIALIYILLVTWTFPIYLIINYIFGFHPLEYKENVV